MVVWHDLIKFYYNLYNYYFFDIIFTCKNKMLKNFPYYFLNIIQ